MGIENRNGILSGIDNEKAQQIRQAILDGTLTNEEAKKLGLTPEEQKYLQDAFNFGEVQIGDRLVVKNFGSEKDVYGEKNYHLTQTANRGTYQIEGSKVGYSVTEHNLNTDDVETKYYTDADEEISKAQYKAMQNGVKFFTAPDGNGYVGVSFKDRTDKNGNVLLDKDGKAEQEPVITYYSKELIPISEKMFNQMTELNGAVYNALKNEVVLHHSKVVDAANPLDVIKAIVGGSYACSDGLVSLKQDVDVDINVKSNDNSAIAAVLQEVVDLLKQLRNGQIEQGANFNNAIAQLLSYINVTNDNIGDIKGLVEQLLSVCKDDSAMLKRILDAICQNNNLLKNIENGLAKNNQQNADILKTVMAILDKLGNIEQLMSKFPELAADIKKIYEAVKEGNATLSQIGSMVSSVLQQVIKNGNTQLEIKELIKKLNAGDPDAVASILAKLDDVINLLKNIDKSVKENTNVTQEMGQKILDAIAKLGADQAANFTAILNAIKNNEGGHGADYTNLLNLILAKLDKIDQHNQAGYEALLAKMDEILQAIKDHHVTVDVTGTVTCNCNCGNNGSHEGILDDIDGLIS